MEPRPSRPRLPRGYGTDKATGAPGERLPWRQVRAWLAEARNYWVCTTRPDGRPHAKPVWAAWLDDRLIFLMHAETVTARNLDANPAVVVHLESGEQVAIVEGTAERLVDRALLARYGEASIAKYDWRISPEDLDPDNPESAVYSVRPRVALSWAGATQVGATITRWSFDRAD